MRPDHTENAASRKLVRANRQLTKRNQALTEQHALQDRRLRTSAHDLRNMLSAVRGYADLLEIHLDRGLSPVGQLGVIRNIRQAAHHMLALVEDLQTESSEICRHPTDLIALARNSVEQLQGLAHRAGIQLEFWPEEDLQPVALDAHKLHQMLDNLLGNALKFSPPGSLVSLSIRCVGDQVVVEVRDNGPGMAGARLPASGAPFPVGRGRGGLGLHIVKRIVEAHRGTIEVLSEPGQGSLFRIALPVKASDEP